MGLSSKQSIQNGSARSNPGMPGKSNGKSKKAGFFERLFSAVKKTAEGQGVSQMSSSQQETSEISAQRDAWQLDDHAFDTVGQLLAQEADEQNDRIALQPAGQASPTVLTPLIPSMSHNPYRTSLSLEDMPGYEAEAKESKPEATAPAGLLITDEESALQCSANLLNTLPETAESDLLPPGLPAAALDFAEETTCEASQAEDSVPIQEETLVLAPFNVTENSPTGQTPEQNVWSFNAETADFNSLCSLSSPKPMGQHAVSPQVVSPQAFPSQELSEAEATLLSPKSDESEEQGTIKGLEQAPGAILPAELAEAMKADAFDMEMPDFSHSSGDDNWFSAHSSVDFISAPLQDEPLAEESMAIDFLAPPVVPQTEDNQPIAISPSSEEPIHAPEVAQRSSGSDDFGLLPQGPQRSQQASNSLPEGVALNTLIQEDFIQFVSGQTQNNFQTNSNDSTLDILYPPADNPATSQDEAFAFPRHWVGNQTQISPDKEVLQPSLSEEEIKLASQALIQDLFSKDNPALTATDTQSEEANEQEANSSFEVVYDDEEEEDAAGYARPLPLGDAYIHFENNLKHKPIPLDLDEAPETYFQEQTTPLLSANNANDEAATDYTDALDELYGSYEYDVYENQLSDNGYETLDQDDETVYELGTEPSSEVLESMPNKDLLSEISPQKPSPLLLEEVFVKDGPTPTEQPALPKQPKSSFEQRVLLEESRFTKNSIDQLISRYFSQD
ncbi:MAG: hypothetical protein VKJ04_03335 [Vampirovibrionales bacterium]|nr:hypothetical protein [Vampirovibrionales bacterium]